MRKAVRKHVEHKPGSVKSAGYLRAITDTGHFRSGYNECPGCGGPKKWVAGFCYLCQGNKQIPDPVRQQQRKQNGEVHYALCGAQRSSKVIRATGMTCMNAAGWKTPHPGIGHCYLHGGLMPTQMLHALRIRADIEMREEMAREQRAEKKATKKAAAAATSPDEGEVDVTKEQRHLAKRERRKKIRFKKDLPSHQRRAAK